MTVKEIPAMIANDDNGFVASIRKNWVLIFFIGGLIVQWTTTNGRLTALEKAQDKTQIVTDKNTADIAKVSNDFNVAIVEIKANYIFIKEKLEKLDNQSK